MLVNALLHEKWPTRAPIPSTATKASRTSATRLTPIANPGCRPSQASFRSSHRLAPMPASSAGYSLMGIYLPLLYVRLLLWGTRTAHLPLNNGQRFYSAPRDRAVVLAIWATVWDHPGGFRDFASL